MIQLHDLSLDALGKFMYDATIKLGELSKNGKLDLCTLQETSSYMDNMLRIVPPLLANNVTCTLQNYVLSAMTVIKHPGFHFCFKNCECLMNDIVVKMWFATILPSTTSLVLTRDCLPLKRANNVTSETNLLMNKVFTKVRNVSVLKCDLLKGVNIFNNPCRFENLIELSFRDYDGRTLIKLSENCCKLKKLDIRGYISDDSVESLVKFKYLEYLDIRKAYITNYYISFIIENMPNLKVFKSILSDSEISLLGKHNLNLACLDFIPRYNSIFIPNVFKNLISISVSSSYPSKQNFNFLKDALVEIGPQLQELRLRNIEGTDLHFISDNCPSLKIIGLSFVDIRHLGFPSLQNLNLYVQDNPIPIFPSVLCCELNFMNCYLVQQMLTSFVNVKKVVTDKFHRPFDILCKYILDRMKEGTITELYVKQNRLQLSGSQLLIQRSNGSICVKQMTEFENVVEDMFNKKLQYRNFLAF